MIDQYNDLQAREHQAVMQQSTRLGLRGRQHDLRVWLAQPNLRPDCWSQYQTETELAEVEDALKRQGWM